VTFTDGLDPYESSVEPTTREDVDAWFGHPGFVGSEHPLAEGYELEDWGFAWDEDAA
jgi:hypothetical protein